MWCADELSRSKRRHDSVVLRACWSHVVKKVYRGRCWRSDDCLHPSTVWQAAFIRAKPGPTIGEDIAIGVQRADPASRAYNAPQRGQGDVKLLPKGSE